MTELSREAILAMVPGRELDVLIQQRIFKSEYPSLEEMKSIAEKQWEMQPGCIHFLMGFDAWKEDGEFKWEYNAPNYSGSIAKAWEVANVYWSFDVRKGPDGQWWDCRIIDEDGLVISHATEETALLAICRCALLTTLEES